MADRAVTNIFKIDLLKGQALPQSSGASGIFIGVLTVALPVLIAIGLSGLFVYNKVSLNLLKSELKTLQSKTDKLSDYVEFQKNMDSEKTYHNQCLAEVKTRIEKFNQWSPILTELAENMPASVVLTELEVKQDSVKKKVPRENNPEKFKEINVLITTLSLKLSCDAISDNDESIRAFRDYLSSSPSLGPKLEKVEISNKETEVVDGRNVYYYMMDCVFKVG